MLSAALIHYHISHKPYFVRQYPLPNISFDFLLGGLPYTITKFWQAAVSITLSQHFVIEFAFNTQALLSVAVLQLLLTVLYVLSVLCVLIQLC